MMLKLAAAFFATLVLYGTFDLLFINLFAKAFIQKQVGPLLAEQPDLSAGIVFYLIFTAGLLYFCIYPAHSWQQAALNGAFFGLVAYATYELVNKALLAGWPLALVVVDIAWGIFVGAAVCSLSYLLLSRMAWTPVKR
ncbi:MAG: DUF2177 family protein [Lewinellaceae bacterium]|nr:DUF2177 family protein [Lewinellaceae bacterium]